MLKRRITLRVRDDEVVVVGTVEQWKHMILVYETLADEAVSDSDYNLWMQQATWVREWVEKGRQAQEAAP